MAKKNREELPVILTVLKTDIRDINDINGDFIIKYCKEKKEEAWLKACAEEEVKPDKNGNERHKSFVELRRDFINHFDEFKALRPKQKTTETIWDRIKAL